MERAQAVVVIASDELAVRVLEEIQAYRSTKQSRHVREFRAWAKEGTAERCRGSITKRHGESRTSMCPLALMKVPDLNSLTSTIEALGYRRSQVVVVLSSVTIEAPRGCTKESHRQFVMNATPHMTDKRLSGFPSIVFCKSDADPKRVGNQIVADFVVNFAYDPALRRMPWGLARLERVRRSTDSGAWRSKRSESRRLTRVAEEEATRPA